jgi:hypothetical protein
MLLYAVAPVEALDPARGIDEALLSGVKRMALGTDFDVEFAHRRAGLKSVAARAGNNAATVFGMDCGFHLFNSQGQVSCRKRYHPLRSHTIHSPDPFLPTKLTTILIFAILTTLAAIPAATLAIAAPANSAAAVDSRPKAPKAATRTPPSEPANPAPGFAPDSETIFAPILELAPPGPGRAARAIAIFDRQLAFQRAISFHPELDDALTGVVEKMPPRESTLIRASALYSQTDIPWQQLKDGAHQISVAGAPRSAVYLYQLTNKYVSPQSPGHLAGQFTVTPVPRPDAETSSVTGALGGELLMNTYPASAAVDLAAAALTQIHGNLKAPWDTAPGQFNDHDRAALARFHREMPALAAKLDHYLIFHNVLDEFDGPGGPIVLFNADVEVRMDALEAYPHLYAFYRKVAPVLVAESAIEDSAGNYWMRTRFARGRMHLTFMDRDGLLTAFDKNGRPAGASVALGGIERGSYRTKAAVRVYRLGMVFGLDNLGFTTDYRRDGDSIVAMSTMNAVPDLIAPPGIHKVIDLIAGEFLRVMAQGHGGLTSTFASRRTAEGLDRYALGFTGEFEYSPTLEFLARVGDAIADQHNETVRVEERKFGEELFDAFASDYNRARPRILALDAAKATGK